MRGAVRSASPPTPRITCGQSEPTITESSRFAQLPFPTVHVRPWRWGQCLVAFQGSTHIRVVCLVPKTQSPSLMLAFDAQGGWTGRRHLVVCPGSVGRARECPACTRGCVSESQCRLLACSVLPDAQVCVCERGRKCPVEEPVFICLLLLLLVISQNASSH